MDYQCTQPSEIEICRQAEEIERQREYERLEIAREKSMQEFTDTFKEFLERLNIQRKEEEKLIFEEAARQEEEKRIAKEKEAAELEAKRKIQECFNIEEKSIPQVSTRSRKFRIDPTLSNFTISTKRILLSEFEIPPVTPNLETVNSLSMGDKHLDTSKDSLESSVKDPIPIPSESNDTSNGARDSLLNDDKFQRALNDWSNTIKSSVDDLVPTPSESADLSDGESECDVPINDDSSESHFTTFSNPLFDSNTIFSSDEEDILFVEPVATMENNIEELNEDESFDPGEGGNVVLPNVEEDDTFTFIICTLLPFVTYPELRCYCSSSGGRHVQYVVSVQSGVWTNQSLTRGTRRVSVRVCFMAPVLIIGNHEAVGGVQKDYNTPKSSNMSGGVLERTKLPLPLGGYKWSTQQLFEEENLELDLVY
ncbi:hypothetical protein Tco_0713385 [Tanacetum coccineum]